MRELIPFILPLVGLFWTVVGARQLLWPPRRRRAQNGSPEAEHAAAAEPTGLRPRERLSGFFWFGLGVLVLWSSDVRPGQSPALASSTAATEGRLAELVTQQINRVFHEESCIGMVVAVVADGEEAVLGFGTRRVGRQSAPDGDTVFEIGSITKVFTGILLAQSLEQGDLALDAPLADHLPDGWTLSESARNVTLEHLVTHTSGFPRLPDNLFTIVNGFKAAAGGDPYRNYSESEFQEAVATVQLQAEPGVEHEYSNFAVSLLGHVLATKNGTDYDTLVRTRICEPLGMRRTMVASDQWQQERMAAGYRSSSRLGPITLGLASSDWQLPNHLAGAGGLRSTGNNMLTFLKANMGLVDSPVQTAIERSHQQLFQVDKNRAMGMAWVHSLDEPLGQRIIWHNGGTGGFRSYLGFTEDRRYGVVVLSNTARGVDDLAKTILRTVASTDSNEP